MLTTNPTLSLLPISNLVNEFKNTEDLGFIVSKCFPLNTIYFEFHNSNYECFTLIPIKDSYKFLRNTEEVVVALTFILPSLKLNNCYTHYHTQEISRNSSLKTLTTEITRSFMKIYKLSRNF